MDGRSRVLYRVKQIVAKTTVYIICYSWVVVSISPLIFALINSFKKDTDIYLNPFKLPSTLQFVNYYNALIKYSILRGLFNSLVYAIAATIIVIIVCLVLSYFVTRYSFRLKGFVNTYFLLGITLPIHASLVPLSVLISDLHLRNTYSGIVLVYAAVSISFAFMVISGYMRSIPKEIDESAIMDGCGPLRTIFYIIAPLSTPALVVASILNMKATYNDLVYGTLLLTKNQFVTLSIAILSLKTEADIQVNVSFAAICISVIPLLILYAFFQKGLEQGITAGAVKM